MCLPVIKQIMMIDFKIDIEKCTECSLCSKECPTLIIDGKKGIPEIKEGKEKQCIKCQHCLAVCPTGALSILGKNPEDSVLVKGEIPSTNAMKHLIQTRRTIRKYKDEILSTSELDDLLQTAAFAPTGHNKNQVLLTLTKSIEQRDKLRVLVYDAIKEVMDAGKLPDSLAMFGSFQKVWDSKGIDVLFRNAPHIILASAPSSINSCVADCVISLTYMELYANTKGIGTLWDGLAKVVFDKIAPELKLQLGIPEEHTLGYIMVFGKPAVKYTRSVQSEGLNVNTLNL